MDDNKSCMHPKRTDVLKDSKTATLRLHLISPGPMYFSQQLQVVELSKSPSIDIIFHSQDLRGSMC